MAKQTTEAIITLNGKQPIEVLNQMHSAAEKIKAEMEQVQQKMKGMSPKDDAYKQLKGSLKELKGQYDLLSSAQVKDIEATQRLQAAVDNLASTSLKDLRKALGDGKRQIEGLSEAELEQANTIRSLMKTVGDQVRLLEGKFVKIREGLASIGTQSDQWLGKAIAQQQELMAVTRRGTKEYKEQEQVMQMLTAEQNKRNAAISAEATARRQAQFKQQVASSRQMLSSGDLSKYSSSEVQTSINTLKQAQSQAAMGGSEWQRLAAEIKKAEDELDRLLGKTKEVKQQMSEGDARSILGNIGGHTEQEVREAINALKLLQSTVNVGGNQWNAYAADIERAETELGKLTGRVKEAKQGLSMNDVESRMQNLNAQSERSLKEMLDYLQKAKAELAPYSQQWKDVATQIDAVKERMANVQAAMPYVRDETAAQFIARNDRMDFGNGTTHDITRKDLQWSKDFLQKQLDVTPVADTAKIQQIQEALGLIDERIKALNGDTEKSAMSTEKLNEVLGNIKTASLKELRDASAELKKQLDGLAPSSSAAKQVKKQMQDLDREIKQVEDDMVDVNDVIARSKNGKASISELKKAYKQLEDELNHLDISSKEFTSKRKDLEALRDKIDEVTVSVHKQRSAWKTAMKNLTAYAGLFQVFDKVKGLVTGAIKKNLEYSGSLTDIRKVSGLTMDEVNQLSTELSKIDTRTSVEGLAKLSYEGAKLGVGKYGVDGMKQFVAAADKINVAIGEEMGEEALPALLKMTEVMGLIPKMGLEKSIEATGSAMFKLASTSTATSNDIVEFARRCTGVARTAGITTDQLLALGSAFSAQMASPEVAATAMSKFIVALQKNHNIIEKDLSIPAGTINSMYSAGHAMDAIVLILEKMKEKGNMNALGEIFKDVGGDGQRLISSMVTMAKNVDMLKDHLYESKDAFDKATAVGDEYAMQQQSAIGILERANNLWEKAFVNPDGVDAVKEMAKWWYTMSATMTSSPLLKGTLQLALSSILTLIKALSTVLPVVIGYLVSQGIFMAITNMKSYAQAVWAAIKAMGAYIVSLRTANTAQATLNATTKVNPWVALASVIFAVVGAVYGYVQQTREAAKAQAEAARKANEWRNNLVQAQIDASTLTRKLDNYKRILENVKMSQEDRNQTIRRFNHDFHSYITNLGIEINNVNDLRKHYKALSIEIRKASFYRSREKSLEEGLAGNTEEMKAAARQLAEALKLLPNGSTVDVSSIQGMIDSRKYGPGQIFNKIKQMTAPSKTKTVYRGGKLFNVKKTEVDLQVEKTQMAALYKQVWKKLTYLYNSTRRYTKKENDIYKDYERIGLDRDYTPYTEEDTGSLSNLATDKDAIKEEKRRKAEEKKHLQEQRQAWRNELKQKQTEAKAIIDNFNNYYERQINEKIAKAIKLGMDEEDRKFFIEPLRVNQNEGARQLRLAIAGKKNSWDNFKLNIMPQDMLEKDDETGVNLSKDLLSDVQGVNVDALRSKLDDLGSSLNIPFNSILAEVLAKSTKNAQENLSLTAQQKDARLKEALEHDYVGVVKQNMYDSFNKMGYANPNETELLNKAAFDKRKANIIAMFEKAREDITKVYEADVSTQEGRGLLMKTLFGDDPDGMAARIKEVLGEDASEWKTFYRKLLQYSDEYDAAQKKSDDERKNLDDYNWNKSDFKRGYDVIQTKMEQEASIKGKYRTIGERMGMQDITANDPELEMMKARMAFAQRYYDFLEKHHATEVELAAARKDIMSAQASYAQKLTSGMFEQYNNLMSFMGPLNDFGSSVGEAFSTMIDNASEGRKAIRSALKQMIKQFAMSSLQMISQQQIDRAQTTAHYTELLLMQQLFGTAQVQAKIANGTAMIAAQEGINLTEEQLEGVHQQVMAALRSAGIFGWCVSTLGPIAGPIAYGAMMSILMGLLSFAISRIGGGDKVSNSSSSGKNTKLVSGMLTYDSGNVQDMKPFVGDNGEIYWAKEQDKPKSGVNLLTTPTATTINGQRALVAENGPELVIGRETTKAMMMNNPSLLKALVNYDANYSGRNAARRAFDEGNLAEALGNLSSGASATDGLIADSRAANIALITAINTLMQRLDQPIHAKIDMYGRGNLYDSMSKANQFMKGKS